jgi:hypothetical protein
MGWRTLPLLLLAGALPARTADDPKPGASAAPAVSRDVPDAAREATARAVAWILNAQNLDGSWGLDARTGADISCTVVAALAVMANGTTERGGIDPRRVTAVRRGLDYVMRQARGMKGDIARGEVTLVQNKLGQRVHTFFATVFLTQVYGMRGSWISRAEAEEVRDAISQLTDHTVKSQGPDGSWHKDTFGSLKATCMAWLALRSAASAGFDVENASVLKTLQFIKSQYNPQSKLFDRFTGQGNYQTIYATASCLRVLYAMGEGNSPEAVGATEAFMKYVRTGQMGAAFLTVEGEDYMSAAVFTHALLAVEADKRWSAWFPWITGELLKRQNKDGSWTSTACITGRTFATAFSLLTLQAPYRLLPILEQ